MLRKSKPSGLVSIAAVTSITLLALSTGVLVQARQEETYATSATAARDPGVRAGSIGAGEPIATLSSVQLRVFLEGEAQFKLVYSVSGNAPIGSSVATGVGTNGAAPGRGGQASVTGAGLGPVFNSNSCSSCHAQPMTGGTSPSASEYPAVGANPQVAVGREFGAGNTIPSFISADGPVRAVRFPFAVNADGTLSAAADGDVHELFTIAGRSDAPNCAMSQPNFEQAAALNDAIFRIPTPMFGSGLIENIPDATIVANMNAKAALKKSLGISGHPNTGVDDQWQQTRGTIARFGWKAQHNSLEVFSGEAYTIEMGVTNSIFGKERGYVPAGCFFGRGGGSAATGGAGLDLVSDMMAIADFMRFLAPPARSAIGIPGNPSPESVLSGQRIFSNVHCDACHTVELQTGESSYAPALSHQPVPLYSDLLLHHMGAGLADRVTQGSAGPDEFRTAPLWGAGQRVFFLHDGRANPGNGGMLNAIEAHAGAGSEANGVISLFHALNEKQRQDLLNFLRSL